MWKFLGTSKAAKWLFSTVFLAFLPILFRGILWIISISDTMKPLSTADLLLYSLIINLSILNELRHLDAPELNEWKEKYVTAAFVTNFVISPLLFSTYVQEIYPLFKESLLLNLSVLLAIVSTWVGFSIFYKINFKLNTYPKLTGG